MPHEQTRTLPKCASYPNTTVCIPVHIHTHLRWLQMQYILLLLSKTLITLHSLISHKYSEGRAVIRAYIYPTWLEEKPVQRCPQGWASPTRLLPRVERGQQWTHSYWGGGMYGGTSAGEVKNFQVNELFSEPTKLKYQWQRGANSMKPQFTVQFWWNDGWWKTRKQSTNFNLTGSDKLNSHLF